MLLHRAVYSQSLLDVHTVATSENINDTNYDGETPLHAAAFMDRPDIVEYLLDRGAAIDARDNNDMTPIHSAVEGGAMRAAHALLERGADPTIRNVFGDTPLDTSTYMHGPHHPMTVFLQ